MHQHLKTYSQKRKENENKNILFIVHKNFLGKKEQMETDYDLIKSTTCTYTITYLQIALSQGFKLTNWPLQLIANNTTRVKPITLFIFSKIYFKNLISRSIFMFHVGETKHTRLTKRFKQRRCPP